MDPDTRAHLLKLIERLPPIQLPAVETLLEAMLDEEEPTSAE